VIGSAPANTERLDTFAPAPAGDLRVADRPAVFEEEEVLLGLPSLYLIARLGRLAWWSASFTGLVAGLSISLLLHLPMPLYAPIGFVWALVFYLTWVSGPEPTNAEAVRLARLKKRNASLPNTRGP
jgi:hypothetical protein